MKQFDLKDIPDDYVEMSSGRRFRFRNPVYDPKETAHALSLLCRFAGHCKRFYSVAEHSILVANLMREYGWGNPFEGLMHDATESILSDICSPIKHGMLPDYKRVEAYFERALRGQFSLPLKMTKGCKRADWAALVIEARILLPTGGVEWNVPAEAVRDADDFLGKYSLLKLGMMPMHKVAKKWMEEFNALKPEHHR